MNIGINKKTILSSFHWYGTWLNKSNIHSGNGSQSQGRDKFDASFSRGGHLLRKAVRHPSLSNLAIIFIWIDKVHVVDNSQKIIWIFTIANSRNIDLTEKQHSRHQQFLRIPLSPLEAGSRLPRSRDHLFSHSMSKASLPQGPDMWYLTFYENKVPIYQTTISNSFYFKISPWPLLYETVEQNLITSQDFIERVRLRYLTHQCKR